MSFAIITNFHFPCSAHTKAIVIIRNQILRTAVQGISQMCDFIRAVRKLQELTTVLKKKTERRKLLYIFLPKAMNSGCNTLFIYTTACKCGALKVFIYVCLYLGNLSVFPVKIHLLLSLNSEETQTLQLIHKV